MKKLFFIALGFYFPLCFSQDFGPWPQGYLLEGGLLSCSTVAECRSPQIADIQTLREDWQKWEAKRIERLDNLKSEARGHLDSALAKAQMEIVEYEASEFGRILMEEINRATEHLSPLLKAELDLWVSSNSPVYELFNQLEDLIHQNGDRKSKLDKEVYHRWWKSPEVQHILRRIKSIKESYFSEALESPLLHILRDPIELAKDVTFNNCPKPVSEYVEKSLGQATLFKDPKNKIPSLLENYDKFMLFYLSSRQSNELVISCDQKKLFGRPRLKAMGKRKYELQFKVIQEKYELPAMDELRPLASPLPPFGTSSIREPL